MFHKLIWWCHVETTALWKWSLLRGCSVFGEEGGGLLSAVSCHKDVKFCSSRKKLLYCIEQNHDIHQSRSVIVLSHLGWKTALNAIKMWSFKRRGLLLEVYLTMWDRIVKCVLASYMNVTWISTGVMLRTLYTLSYIHSVESTINAESNKLHHVYERIPTWSEVWSLG